MTPEEMQGFQDKLRQDFGHTIRVRVEKPLTPEEREALINHIRYTRNDFNASIEIIEPIPIDFDFEVLPFEEEIQKPMQVQMPVVQHPIKKTIATGFMDRIGLCYKTDY